MKLMEWWCPRSQGSALCHWYLLQQDKKGAEKLRKSTLELFPKTFYEVLCSEGTLFVCLFVLGRQQWFCFFLEWGDVPGQESFSTSAFPINLCHSCGWGGPVVRCVILDGSLSLKELWWQQHSCGCLDEVLEVCLSLCWQAGALGSWGALEPSSLCF